MEGIRHGRAFFRNFTVCADIKEVQTFAFITIGTRKKLKPKCVDCYRGRASQLLPIACVPSNNPKVNLVLIPLVSKVVNYYSLFCFIINLPYKLNIYTKKVLKMMRLGSPRKPIRQDNL